MVYDREGLAVIGIDPFAGDIGAGLQQRRVPQSILRSVGCLFMAGSPGCASAAKLRFAITTQAKAMLVAQSGNRDGPAGVARAFYPDRQAFPLATGAPVARRLSRRAAASTVPAQRGLLDCPGAGCGMDAAGDGARQHARGMSQRERKVSAGRQGRAPVETAKTRSPSKGGNGWGTAPPCRPAPPSPAASAWPPSAASVATMAMVVASPSRLTGRFRPA